MKVTIKTGLTCVAGAFSEGEVVELSDDVGGHLIKFGLAELVEEGRTADRKPSARKATAWPKSDPDSDGA